MTEVAASSSLSRGGATFSGSRSARRRPSSRSKPASGEPSYPEMNEAARSPLRRSRQVRSAIIRTSAAMPGR